MEDKNEIDLLRPISYTIVWLICLIIDYLSFIKNCFELEASFACLISVFSALIINSSLDFAFITLESVMKKMKTIFPFILIVFAIFVLAVIVLSHEYYATNDVGYIIADICFMTTIYLGLAIIRHNPKICVEDYSGIDYHSMPFGGQ